MPINAHPDYLKAEKEYLNSVSIEDKIFFLEEMIRTAPKHKGGENLRAELKTRLKKLRERAEKSLRKFGAKKGIRKEGFQFVLVGLANSGKSSLLSKLTNASPRIAEHGFSTVQPEIGTFDFQGVKAQVIDLPSLGSEHFDTGITNNADCLLYVVNDMGDIEKIDKQITRAKGKKIVVFGKLDILSRDELRKLEATIKSRKIKGLAVSSKSGDGIQNLKNLMFEQMEVIRVYMKEPGKEKSSVPAVLKEGATVKDAGESIYKGFSKTVKEVRLTGPSGKFPNQKVGLAHVLKDRDVVEFHTR